MVQSALIYVNLVQGRDYVANQSQGASDGTSSSKTPPSPPLILGEIRAMTTGTLIALQKLAQKSGLATLTLSRCDLCRHPPADGVYRAPGAHASSANQTPHGWPPQPSAPAVPSGLESFGSVPVSRTNGLQTVVVSDPGYDYNSVYYELQSLSPASSLCQFAKTMQPVPIRYALVTAATYTRTGNSLFSPAHASFNLMLDIEATYEEPFYSGW